LVRALVLALAVEGTWPIRRIWTGMQPAAMGI
jgi:hypothetical protein